MMFFHNEVLNLFDDLFDDAMFSTMNVPDIMRTDAYEIEGNLMLEVELPGYEKKDIRAELKDGYLTIMAARPEKLEKEFNKRHYSRRERHIGGCKRSYYIGNEIQQEDIQAAFKDGVLKLLIQRKDKEIEDHRKMIEIK